MWTKKFDRTDRKKFLHLIEYIIEAINSGKLEAGQALPTQRELSKSLGVSIGTITKAFKELEKLGYLTGQIGRGTYVRDITKDFSNFWYREMDVPYKYNLGHYRTTELFNHSIQLSLLSSIREVANSNDLYAHLHDLKNTGTAAQKSAFADWLLPLGFKSITHQEITILSSDVFNVYALINTLSKKGDCLLVEEIGDRIIWDQLEKADRSVETVKLDEGGINLESLESQIRKNKARLLITLPTFHNPTGHTTGLKRKKEISSICEKYGVKIIEDGKVDFFNDGPINPYFELNPEIGIYVTGFYFHINPSLTTSMIVGSAEVIKKVEEFYTVTHWTGSQLLQETCTHLIHSGNADKIIQERKKLLKERNQFFNKTFGNGKEIGTDLDVLKWLKIPNGRKSSELTQQAYENGILIRNSDIFSLNPDNPSPPYVRICNAAIHSFESYKEALRELKNLMEEGTPDLKVR